MIDRVESRGEGVEHVAGVSPRYDDLSRTGMDLSRGQTFAAIKTAIEERRQPELLRRSASSL